MNLLGGFFQENEMNFDYVALIVGAIGPDVWEKEADINAANFVDAAEQAQAKADEWGGQVVLLEQNDKPPTAVVNGG